MSLPSLPILPTAQPRTLRVEVTTSFSECEQLVLLTDAGGDPVLCPTFDAPLSLVGAGSLPRRRAPRPGVREVERVERPPVPEYRPPLVPLSPMVQGWHSLELSDPAEGWVD